MLGRSGGRRWKTGGNGYSAAGRWLTGTPRRRERLRVLGLEGLRAAVVWGAVLRYSWGVRAAVAWDAVLRCSWRVRAAVA